ncbi:hypothetical protein J3E69DRAFT_356778 [Trichoderma sp. SZMC 28015]
MSGALCVLSSFCIKALFGVEHHSIGIVFATASLAIGTAGPHWPSPIAHHPSHPHARRLLLGLRGYLKGSSRGFGVKLQQTVIVLVIADKKSGGGRHHSPLQPNTSIHRQLCCALAYSYRQICFDAACVDDAAGKRTCNSTHFGLRGRSAEARNSSAPRRAEQNVALVKLAKIVSCPHPMAALRLRFDLPQRQHACLEMKEAPRRCCLVAEEQACGKSRAQNVRRQSKWPLAASYEYVFWSRPLIDSMICVSSQSSVPASQGASEGKR